MNDLKKPSSLVAGTNVIFTVGGFMYLYKQFELLKEENEKLRQDFRTLTSKFQQYVKDDLENEALLKTTQKEVKSLKAQIGNIDVKDEIKAIKYSLTDADIEIKSPAKPKKKRYYSSSESEESIETPKKRYPTKKKELKDDDIIDLYRQKKS